MTGLSGGAPGVGVSGVGLALVGLGAAAGAWARWFAGLWLNGRWNGFPLGTLAVNLVGGLAIGVALAVFARRPDDPLRLLIVTGFLGGLTTFSSFSGESLALLLRGEPLLALAHTVLHVVASLALAALGYGLTRQLLGG